MIAPISQEIPVPNGTNTLPNATKRIIASTSHCNGESAVRPQNVQHAVRRDDVSAGCQKGQTSTSHDRNICRKNRTQGQRVVCYHLAASRRAHLLKERLRIISKRSGERPYLNYVCSHEASWMLRDCKRTISLSHKTNSVAANNHKKNRLHPASPAAFQPLPPTLFPRISFISLAIKMQAGVPFSLSFQAFWVARFRWHAFVKNLKF